MHCKSKNSSLFFFLFSFFPDQNSRLNWEGRRTCSGSQIPLKTCFQTPSCLSYSHNLQMVQRSTKSDIFAMWWKEWKTLALNKLQVQCKTGLTSFLWTYCHLTWYLCVHPGVFCHFQEYLQNDQMVREDSISSGPQHVSSHLHEHACKLSVVQRMSSRSSLLQPAPSACQNLDHNIALLTFIFSSSGRVMRRINLHVCENI